MISRVASVASPALTVAARPMKVFPLKVTRELTPTAPVRGDAKVIEVAPIELIFLGVVLPVTVTLVKSTSGPETSLVELTKIVLNPTAEACVVTTVAVLIDFIEIFTPLIVTKSPTLTTESKKSPL